VKRVNSEFIFRWVGEWMIGQLGVFVGCAVEISMALFAGGRMVIPLRRTTFSLELGNSPVLLRF